MRVLLDTHILLWMIGESRSLSASAMHVLADEANDLFFSSVSIAEVAIKHQKNAVRMAEWQQTQGIACALAQVSDLRQIRTSRHSKPSAPGFTW